MSKIELLLIQLMEECNEASQRASKALRFGIDEKQIGQGLTNWQRLRFELNDIMALTRLLEDENISGDDLWDNDLQLAKMEKVAEYLELSKVCGILK